MTLSHLSPVKLVLPEAMKTRVAVWRLDFDLENTQQATVFKALNSVEQLRTQKYYRLADQIRFSETRATLRALLGTALGVPALSIEFAKHQNGKPYVQDYPELQFNVSHAGEHALIAIGRGAEIGIDIERIKPERSLVALAAHVFTPAEQQACRFGQDIVAFYAIWSGKEAVLKAWGTGIAGQILSFSALPQPAGEFALQGERAEKTTRLWAIDAPSGYQAALALEALRE